jgi:transglutaminase-like putative cysteine protease
MSISTHFRISSYVLIASGFLAAASAGADLVLFAIFGCILVASWFLPRSRFRRAIPKWMLSVAAIATLSAGYLDWKCLSHSLSLSVLHVLLLFAAVMLLIQSSDRDFGCLYLLSFGALLDGAALTASPIFFVCLCLFLASGISSLLLFEMRQSNHVAVAGTTLRPLVVAKSLRGTKFELFSGFPLRALSAQALVLFVIVLLLAVPFFFLLPRVSLGIHRSPSARQTFISGFSERAELGAIGTIKKSPDLVMKVKVDTPPEKLPPDLKWRGIALDYFDGKTWSCSQPVRASIPTQGGYFKLEQSAQGPELLMQTFFLEPIATDVVFASHKVLAVSTDLGWVERDNSGNVFSMTPRSGEIRYSAISDISKVDPTLFSPLPASLPEDIMACCLQTPREDPRVAELARRVTKNGATSYDKARSLENYLRTNYEYSLDLQGTPDRPDPLAMFLFDVRRGHCEYFATAMAIMLRQVGIPSRLVNGFHAGEYNRLSGHWIVRQYDAHSWVDAYLSPYGWVEFDPTPAEPARQQPLLKTPAGVLDALSFWWTDIAVNYDLREQSKLIAAGQASLQDFQASAVEYGRVARQSIAGRFTHLRPSFQASFFVACSLLVAAAFLLAAALSRGRSSALKRRLVRRLDRTGAAAKQEAAIVGFYAEAVSLLQRKGRVRGSSQTPCEFALTLASEPFGAALITLTSMYNRVRFGGRTDAAGAADAAQARSLLHSLRQNLQARGNAP